MAHCCECRSRGKRGSPIDLSGRSSRIGNWVGDGKRRFLHRLTLFAYWGGNRIGDHRRKPCPAVADGDRRIGNRVGDGKRQPSRHRLVCANRKRRWGLHRKWGDFVAIDRTSCRHRVFWRGHGGGWIAISDHAVFSDRRCCWECVSFRDVAAHRFIITRSQRVRKSFVLWGASDNFNYAVQWVSIYRCARQSRVWLCVLPGRNAARSRADRIDKLCGEDAVKTLTTNQPRIANLIDNLLRQIEGNHHGR